jgi:hypothetical protein
MKKANSLESAVKETIAVNELIEDITYLPKLVRGAFYFVSSPFILPTVTEKLGRWANPLLLLPAAVPFVGLFEFGAYLTCCDKPEYFIGAALFTNGMSLGYEIAKKGGLYEYLRVLNDSMVGVNGLDDLEEYSNGEQR